MHKIFTLTAFGWLAFSGTLHFIIDVVSQYLRGKRAPGPETTLHWGLNSAYALGQVLFGLLGLLIAQRAASLLSQPPAVALSLGAAVAWLVFGFVFLEYWEPRIAIIIFGGLVIAAAVTA